MTVQAHHDFETKSTVNLKTAGAHRYAEHPSTDAWGMSWRIGSTGPMRRWAPGDPDPVELLDFIRQGGRIVAHNAAFERAIWNGPIRRRNPHWPVLRPANQDCTMARGLALALPASLDHLAQALKLPVSKDKEGQRLMMQMCRPRRIDPDGTIVWWDDPDKIERLAAYRDNDVVVETLIDENLPALSDAERAVWELSQTINDRGVPLDVPLITRALAAVEEALSRADKRMWRLTDGAVKRCSEAAKIVAWLNARGIPCRSVAKGEIEELVLASQVMGDPVAEEVIRLRRAAAKSSTAKFKAMLACVCADDRARGGTQYHGAGQTGREAGRLWQPQNLPRVDPDRDLPDALRCISLLGLDRGAKEMIDSLELLVDGPLETLSKCLRLMIMAGPGKKLIGGDLSNIEGCVNAWLADETWKLDAYRAYQAGTGPDLYKVTAAAILGKLIEDITKAERQPYGKVPELACGYQGSVGAFVTMAATYLINVAEVARIALANADRDAILLAQMQYARETDTYGLASDVWVGIKIIINAWRAAHPMTVQNWWNLQDAAIEAVGTPGAIIPCGKVKYLVANGFLFCALPSTRVIAYAAPRLKWVEGRGGGKPRRQVQYDGLDSTSHQWTTQSLYGGLQDENIVQAISRDVMVDGMFAAEAAGYQLVLTVHDELLCEVDDNDQHTAAGLKEIMERLPPWAHGLPLAAAAWEDKRYAK